MQTIEDLWRELDTCLSQLHETGGEGLTRWGFRGLILVVHSATLALARIAEAQEHNAATNERIQFALENLADLQLRGPTN